MMLIASWLRHFVLFRVQKAKDYAFDLSEKFTPHFLPLYAIVHKYLNTYKSHCHGTLIAYEFGIIFISNLTRQNTAQPQQ